MTVLSEIVVATTVVKSDDACYSLKEVNEQAPDFRGFHRYRILKVVPGGRLQAGKLVVDASQLREWRFDMGLAVEHENDQFAIIGGVPLPNGQVEILETVGRLVEMAERIHVGYIEPVERPETTDLITAWREQPDRRRKQRKKQSTFGYGPALQRS